ncbi:MULTISPECIES: cobalt-precorrin-7 (C(5))-methyltransferase [Vagococcus]|uniref:Cobalt-precorrin-6y C5-methyltransferase n=1 Tax=Vagococcus fluvialis bH819 TaxID=1255619 RepID=A0A1X6WPP2_9ENTE|nr:MULTISPECIES: cobalt-precorrin-7 (C(5))-methyltransferase [Vagococcus]SLM86227.1 Cobalt-precorrin-6y C5-methyltransferase [Vagococcus fluvialis bH819]
MITVTGIGPGEVSLLLNRVLDEIEQSDIVIGSSRQLDVVPVTFTGVKKELPKKLLELEVFLQKEKDKKVVILASGEPLLYGIGNWMMTKFEAKDIQIIPGISSMQYMFSQLKLSMNDTYFTSSHGKEPNYDLIFSLSKVALVTDEKTGPYQLAEEIRRRGLKRTIFIGENLSYPNENIRKFDESNVPNEVFNMNVVVLLDEG